MFVKNLFSKKKITTFLKNKFSTLSVSNPLSRAEEHAWSHHNFSGKKIVLLTLISFITPLKHIYVFTKFDQFLQLIKKISLFIFKNY